MNILVLGAGGNAGINFIKCLKKATGQNIVIHGADFNKFYRLAGNADHWADIDYSTIENKVKSILDYVDQHGIKMIHAQPDSEVEFLLQYKSVFSRYLFNHSLDLWKAFSNKLQCQKTWGPQFFDFQCCSLQEAITDEKLFNTIAAKGNGTVWMRAIRGAGSNAALPVSSLEEAVNWWQYWWRRKKMDIDDFMLAQYLPGKEYAVQTFWQDGTLLHSQARQRLIYFFGAQSPSGQTSTPAVAKTVHDPIVYNSAYKAILAIQKIPNGIYCVDLKEDAQGYIIPMEINYGRFFTTMDFFACLDVNTPLAYVNSYLMGDKSKRIETIKKQYYWIRGLDKEPRLVEKHDEL